jgi:hypothetical protein
MKQMARKPDTGSSIPARSGRSFEPYRSSLILRHIRVDTLTFAQSRKDGGFARQRV